MDYSKIEKIDNLISEALKEDVSTGDVTTKAIINDTVLCEGKFLVKEDGIVAGLEIAKRVFEIVERNICAGGSAVKFETFNKDGDAVKKGDVVAVVSGRATVTLTAERTALNFLQRMSGIATFANKFQKEIQHTKAKIIDTRKTVPGLRIIDKMAVKAGGCGNHRIGLYDMFLIKDNHIAVAGSVTKAIEACKKYRAENNPALKIEVEVTNIDQLNEALKTGVDIIMLDN